MLTMQSSPANGTYLDAIFPSPLMSGSATPAVSFALDHEASVKVWLYSPPGQRVLLNAETILAEGYHTMTGREAAVTTAGTWFVVLTVDGAQQYIRPLSSSNNVLTNHNEAWNHTTPPGTAGY